MTLCNSQAFIDQPVAKLLWRNSLPMIAAIMALFAYDLLESTLLAFQSEHVLTAFGFTLPITAAMTALAIGLSIRANNKVVHCNCTDKANLAQTISNSLMTCLLIVTLCSCLFFIASEQLLSLTGNRIWTDDINNTAAIAQSDYLDIRYFGWVFMALTWQINATLRALGWMKIASGLMLSWALCKSFLAVIILTPQSPFYANGLETLGFVHLISDALFTFISLLFLQKKVMLKSPQFSTLLSSILRQKRDSSLIVFQQFITPISMAALTAIAANMDTSYVATLALLFRLEVLFLLLPMVLTTSMPAIIGANYWLGHKERVKNLYKLAFSSIAIFQLIVALIVFSQSYFLSSFLCPHHAISMNLESYLNWVPWGYGAAGIAIVFQSCLNAKNLTVLATLITLCHRIIFVLPLSALGAFAFNELGFYQGLMLGHLSAIIPVFFVLHRFGYINKQHQSLLNKNTLKGITNES